MDNTQKILIGVSVVVVVIIIWVIIAAATQEPVPELDIDAILAESAAQDSAAQNNVGAAQPATGGQDGTTGSTPFWPRTGGSVIRNITDCEAAGVAYRKRFNKVNDGPIAVIYQKDAPPGCSIRSAVKENAWQTVWNRNKLGEHNNKSLIRLLKP